MLQIQALVLLLTHFRQARKEKQRSTSERLNLRLAPSEAENLLTSKLIRPKGDRESQC